MIARTFIPEVADSAAAPLMLVIEDDAMLVRLLKHALGKYGFRTLAADNGLDGVRLFHERGSEVAGVLSDVRLPGLDGRGVLAALRSVDPGVRFCFMTGEVGDNAGGELLAAGALHVFSKPFSLADLGARLRALLAF